MKLENLIQPGKGSFQVIEVRSLKSAQWLLRFAILLYAVGRVVIFYRMQHTQIGNYMFKVLGMDHTQARLFEEVSLLIFLGLCLLNLYYSRLVILLPIFAYILMESWAGFQQGGFWFSELSFGAHSLRYITPLVLLSLSLPLRKKQSINKVKKASSWLLRLGLASVFATHGLECLLENPHFIDLIIGTGRLFQISIAEEAALQIMTSIGLLDLMVAILVLLRPRKGILVWAIFWGSLTAFSRMTAYGAGAYTEVLLRSSHIVAPMVLLLLISSSQTILTGNSFMRKRKTKPLNVSDNCNYGP